MGAGIGALIAPPLVAWLIVNPTAGRPLLL